MPKGKEVFMLIFPDWENIRNLPEISNDFFQRGIYLRHAEKIEYL